MRVKIICFVSALVLAASLCISPYASTQRAYANPLVLTASEAAFAAICAAFGISIASNEDAKALFADWELYTDDIDALSAQVSALQDAAIEAGTANGTLTNVTKQQVSQSEVDAINAMFEAAGNTGTFALDQLSMMASDGVLGILPFILSAFMADQVNVVPSDVQRFTTTSGSSISIAFCGDTQPGYSVSNPHYYSSVAYYYFSQYGFWSLLYGNGTTPTSNHDVVFDADSDGSLYCHFSFVDYTRVWPDGATKSSDLKDLCPEAIGSPSTLYFSDLSTILIRPGASIFIRDTGFYTGSKRTFTLYDGSTGVWNTDYGTLTDNPDVIGGSDYWDDVKDQADVLNPSAGAAVIGSDAVFDGDYIANRGSITIPTDWSNSNSWADALGATHAGVAQGALDGTISGATTGIAVDTATGDLVTDTVGNLTKPDTTISTSPSTKFDWSKFLDPSLYLVFPFCLPWDLVELVKTLNAEPEAPVIDWPMPTITGGDNRLHVDLAPWSPVAVVLRTGELVVAAFGLIWITKTMIRN